MTERSADGVDGGDVANIIALAPNSWHGPRMNRQQLLSRLGVRHHVLYSTGPLHKALAPGAAWWPRTIVIDNVHVDLVPRWLAGGLHRPVTMPLVTWALAARWRRLVRKEGRPGAPLVAWVFHPRYWPFVDAIGPDLLIYHAYDFYHQQGRWDEERASAEKQLATNADLVVASSAPIAQYLSECEGSTPLVVENAAEYATFAIDHDATPVPDDLAAIPRPRIGYVGALNRKVDFALLAALAVRLRRCHFVFVGALGRLDDETARSVDQLKALPNAHFLGFKPYGELPPYGGHMDVNLLAYRVSEEVWTEGIYPLKLHEYLATGKPVVSADLPSVRPFRDVVRIVSSPEEWAAALEAELACKSDVAVAARRSVARNNDWSVRAALLDERLTALVRSSG